MARYLVTGVAGFVGSAIARELLNRGEQVSGFDNLSTGKWENINEIADRMNFIEGELQDSSAAAAACRGVDFVLHQAALASVPRSINDPQRTNASNVDGTLTLLVAARDAGVKRVVYAASSSAYGDQPTLPKHEAMQPAPISPYAVSKLAGEMYMQSFYRCYGLETVSLRYFNVFGPRQDPSSPYSGVLAKFIPMMLTGKQPTIFGDGEQSRDFTFVDNVVQANLLACSAPAHLAAGQVINIGTGTRTTLNQVFEILKSITGFSGSPAYGPERSGDVKHSLADLTKAREILGYAPKVALCEGLGCTVDWYRSQIASEVSGACS